MKFFYHIHYSDGLTKKAEINYFDLEETWPVWLGELDNGELEYVKVRLVKDISEEK